ncbi:hypothetical protein BGZ60DRAFT_467230 [Tricladium varicosporioides]|nr:hypothetical protein BGZ60DRAFT_467230 [Hymenoscyphus varicosporioides]
MADNLRGDGLVRVHRALDRLEADPLGPDRARMRLSQSLLLYTSNLSGTATRSASSDTRCDECAALLSQEQLEAKVEEERTWIWYADPHARETKHEEPLELESELETDTETVSSRPFSFSTSLKPPPPKPRRPKSGNEKERIAERRVHKEPLEEEAADHPAPVPANPLVNGSRDTGEALCRQNGDTERSPSASNSLRPRTGKRVLRPTTGQALRPSRKKPSHKDGQPQPVASASLGPVHSSKRRPNASQEMFPGDPPLLSGPDIVEPLPQTAGIPPRRSKRLEPPEPSTAKGPTGITSTDLLGSIAQSRPKRKVAGNPISIVSANPQGISKRQRSSTTRGKARKG